MPSRRLVLSSTLLFGLSVGLTLSGSGVASANEGQWKPGQLEEIIERAKQDGLELDADQLWRDAGTESDGGLMRASVWLGGCSAAFISPDGLVATNHHCAYGALQANSTVEHDYIEDGFLAKTRDEELPAPGRSVRALRKITDVTETIAKAVEGIEDDTARAKAIEKARNELVDACEAAADHRHCRVAGFFMGSRYELHEYVEFEDLRLVYAPPAAIGEYGGETDNWMWPRHTGDFSLLRVYASADNKPAPAGQEGNAPYNPGHFLKPSTEGVNPGDFVGILGYPGKTERYLWSAELERHEKVWLPRRDALYSEWIAILEAAGEKDEAVKIKVAATKKSLANRRKNAAGKIAGLAKMNLLATRQGEDKRLEAQGEEAKATLDGLAAISTARTERGPLAFLLHNLRYAPRSLVIAQKLVTWADNRGKDDLERKSGYRDRDKDRLWNSLEQLTKDHDAGVDVELLASFMRVADGLGEDQRSPGFDAVLGGAKGSAQPGKASEAPIDPYREAATKALEGSALADLDKLKSLFDDPKAVAKSKDPMIVLARALVSELEALEAVEQAERGRLAVLAPAYFELASKLRGQPVYSDANSTLRMSHATVKGYDKWDGETQVPQTMVAGAVAKHTGEGEFNLPAPVLEAAKTAKESRWIDPELGDVPVCFLADGDTTGGNSGSPVIDGKGRLIGFNFDRVWENVAGDYAWRTTHSRNVISDARYLYWNLEVAGADHLLKELGVADYQGPPAKAEEGEGEAAKDQPGADAAASTSKGGCGCSSSDDGALPLVFLGVGLIILGAATAAARRREAKQAQNAQNAQKETNRD